MLAGEVDRVIGCIERVSSLYFFFLRSFFLHTYSHPNLSCLLLTLISNKVSW